MNPLVARIQEVLGCSPIGPDDQEFCDQHAALPDGTLLRRHYWTDEGCSTAVAMAEDPDNGLVLLLAELERTKRGARELGRILDRTLRDALDASGRHDAIEEDGDGDWGVVWETLAELRPRAEKAEAENERLRAAVKSVSNDDSIHLLALCEAGRLILRPGDLYRFEEAPNCDTCRELAEASKARL